MLTSHVVISNAHSGATSFDSTLVDMRNVVWSSVQAQWTGTLTGTVQLQASCDVGTSSTGTGVSNWDDLTSKTFAAAGSSGHGILHLTDIGYFWLRATYTAVSGTGTMTIAVTTKGM